MESCLYDNTLVTLPTGLGKTFIAAVVMYNYFRWFPLSKIVFMAPTKPLVQQQIEACFNIMGIPQIEVSDTVPYMKERRFVLHILRFADDGDDGRGGNSDKEGRIQTETGVLCDTAGRGTIHKRHLRS